MTAPDENGAEKALEVARITSSVKRPDEFRNPIAKVSKPFGDGRPLDNSGITGAFRKHMPSCREFELRSMLRR